MSKPGRREAREYDIAPDGTIILDEEGFDGQGYFSGNRQEQGSGGNAISRRGR